MVDTQHTLESASLAYKVEKALWYLGGLVSVRTTELVASGYYCKQGYVDGCQDLFSGAAATNLNTPLNGREDL